MKSKVLVAKVGMLPMVAEAAMEEMVGPVVEVTGAFQVAEVEVRFMAILNAEERALQVGLFLHINEKILSANVERISYDDHLHLSNAVGLPPNINSFNSYLTLNSMYCDPIGGTRG